MPEEKTLPDIEIQYDAINTLARETGMRKSITPDMVAKLNPDACKRVYRGLLGIQKTQYLIGEIPGR